MPARVLLLLAALAIGAVLHAPGSAPSEGALEPERLERALADVPTADADALRALYAGRDYRALWTAGMGLSSDGQALADELAGAWRDGLDPQLYQDLAGALLQPRGDAPPPTQGGERTAEQVEVRYGLALLQLARHLASGQADPRRVYGDWLPSAPSVPIGAVLQVAAREGPAAALDRVRPPHPAYARLRAALPAYLDRDARGGWPVVPDGPALALGDTNRTLPVLRERLGLPARGGAGGGVFDDGLDAAVRAAQERYGVEVDGVVGPETRAALNVSAGARALQIAANMERWRWLPRDLGADHVLIDAAGMTVAVVQHGARVEEQRAVVGAVGHPTPGFSSSITHVVLSPYWNVPESIAAAEVRPLMARDPGYLARHRMEVLPGGRLRQEPGPWNPLGQAKFIFDTPFGVRLHGTSEPHLFRRRVRAFSHGCIRIEDPVGLAVRLAEPAGWSAERVRAAAVAGEERWIGLPEPVPVHSAYWTAVPGPDGGVRFRPDVYGRDRVLLLALAEARDGRLDLAALQARALPSGTSVGEGPGVHGRDRPTPSDPHCYVSP